jgi:uncharacterized protein (DUF2236 family)
MMRKLHTPVATAFIGLEPIMKHIGSREVSDSVHRHQFIERDSFKRLKNTFDSGIVMIHGTHEESLAVSQRIKGIHEHVRGEIHGKRYTAGDPELLKWVGATLGEATVLAYEFFVGRLTVEEKDQYVRELGPFYADIGLPIEEFPQTFRELQAYTREMIASETIQADDLARHLAPFEMLQQRGSPLLRKVLMSYPKIVMLYFLPDEYRRQFNTEDPKTGKRTVRLQHLSHRQRQFVEKSASLFKAIKPVLPSLRTYYHLRRLLGKVPKYDDQRAAA